MLSISPKTVAYHCKECDDVSFKVLAGPVTLHIGRVSEHFTLVVGDRLVTRRARTFDALFNKNLMFAARDAIVVVGFTGTAFADGKPADQWIAEQLSGELFIGAEPNKPSLRLTAGKVRNWPDVGQATRRLADALTELLPRLTRSERRAGLSVVFAGTQFGRRRPRPIVNFVLADADRGVQKVQQPRGWQDRLGPDGVTPYRWFEFLPGYLIAAERDRLTAELPSSSPDDAESLLVGVIRSVSRRHRTVGSDCMSLLLAPPSNASQSIRCRFLPSSPNTRTIRLGTSSVLTEPTYTPWVLTPQMVMPPMELGGLAARSVFNIGHLQVLFESVPGEAVDVSAPIVFSSLDTQQRRGPP